MIIKKVLLKDCIFKKKSYDQELFESIKKVGNSIPVRVNVNEFNKYEVIDGNKRCTILQDLDIENKVTVVIINDFSCSGSYNWGKKNTH